MPMVLAHAIAERKATMQQNMQLQRFFQKRVLKLGQNYIKMFVCNKAKNSQVIFVLSCRLGSICNLSLFLSFDSYPPPPPPTPLQLHFFV
jgi:hypothetical protein